MFCAYDSTGEWSETLGSHDAFGSEGFSRGRFGEQIDGGVGVGEGEGKGDIETFVVRKRRWDGSAMGANVACPG